MAQDTLCEDCGACCTRIILLHTGEIDKAWVEVHGGKIDGPNIILPIKCEMYDEKTKKCKNYENRPVSCQKFKPISPACLLCRKMEGF